MNYFYGKTEIEARAKAEADGWQDDFIGHNCDDWNDRNCGGWDGESRRCECGNRRVYWNCEQQEDKQWVCWAEAW